MFKKMMSKKTVKKLPTRITNDTVAEHREKVLAGGRKLKYPVQYSRNALVRNAILISLAALVALISLVWVQLYVIKDTSDLAYRITRFLPLPVAKIDGQSVLYGDYLLYHRSTINVLESQGGTETTANDRMKFHKQQALDRALEDAYAKKLANESSIGVDDEQVSQLVEQQRSESGLNEAAYAAVVNDHLHWTMDELRQAMHSTLLRQKVAFSVDKPASKTAQKVSDLLSKKKDLSAVSQALGDSVVYQTDIIVPKDNSDGGLSVAAAKLKVDETSGAVKTLAGDGYYFITRHASDDNSIKYSYIKVPLTVFKQNFTKLKDSDDTKLYINIEAEG